MNLSSIIDEAIKVVNSFGVNVPVIGYTNGLAIVALLLFIWWMLMRKSISEDLPPFCSRCANSRRTILGEHSYCNLKCKYNPPKRMQAIKSFYKEA